MDPLGELAPPGPYFHGTRSRLEVGDELETGVVDPCSGDDRQMVWADTDPNNALMWAIQRNRSRGLTCYVYEVELDQPEVDPLVSRPAGPAPVTSVMAPRGRVLRLVCSVRD